jgi:sugar phosphate isomerase/epimerase
MQTSKLNRRIFVKKSIWAGSLFLSEIYTKSGWTNSQKNKLRLGGKLFGEINSPEEWIKALQAEGYSAAYCPLNHEADDRTVKAYADAAKKVNIIIAEVGAWSNPISPNEDERKKALDKCNHQLDLADRIGARCCVNISGSRGKEWDGHHKDNFTKDTFDLIVESTRKIIDAVNPTRTYFTLETMPWAYPDSADSYIRLIRAIDRKQFAAHFDPVNIINSPIRYYKTGDIIKECFKKFGQHIRSCHAKDIILSQKLTIHLDEIRPGLGNLDYDTFLNELNKYTDTPLMIEHLKTAEEYRMAANFIRNVAKKNGLTFL